MAKPNYQFEKRQRDLAKKAKQDEKRRQKLAATAAADSHGAPTAPDPTLAPAQTADLPDAKAPDSSAKPEA